MKTKRSKEDIALLKIQAVLKTVKKENRLGVLNAARNLALVTGLARANGGGRPPEPAQRAQVGRED